MVTRVPYTGDEKPSLLAALDRHRDVVEWKIEGLDEERLRRSMTSSGTNLLGLVKHLGGVELGWFCSTFGRETGPLPFDLDAEPSSDLRAEPHESAREVLEFYQRARVAADKTIAELELVDVGTAFAFFDGATVSLRWAMIHVLEETIRHAGHMDILRELADGAIGDHNWG